MNFDEFDRQFNQTRRLAIGIMLVSALVPIGLLVFVGWVGEADGPLWRDLSEASKCFN